MGTDKVDAEMVAKYLRGETCRCGGCEIAAMMAMYRLGKAGFPFLAITTWGEDYGKCDGGKRP